MQNLKEQPDRSGLTTAQFEYCMRIDSSQLVEIRCNREQDVSLSDKAFLIGLWGLVRNVSSIINKLSLILVEFGLNLFSSGIHLVHIHFWKRSKCVFCVIAAKDKNTFLNCLFTKKGFLFQEMLNNKRSFFSIESRRFLPTLFHFDCHVIYVCSFQSRFISNSSHCSTVILSKHITSALTTVIDHVIKYSETAFSNSNVNYFWSIKNSSEVIEMLRLRNFQGSQLSSFDFSTLYTSLPHDLIKAKVLSLVNRCFNRE